MHYTATRTSILDRATTYDDLLGRARIDGLDAILEVTNSALTCAVPTVEGNGAATLSWDCDKGARPALNRLGEGASISQWAGETGLPRDAEVDQEQFAPLVAVRLGLQGTDLSGATNCPDTGKDFPTLMLADREVGVAS